MGQQWSHTVSEQLLHFQTSSGGGPGAKAHANIVEKDVVTLCEDGDLLLIREQVAHRKMRVTMDPLVARDISRMQHGHFPTQRVTSLPGSVRLWQI